MTTKTLQEAANTSNIPKGTFKWFYIGTIGCGSFSACQNTTPSISITGGGALQAQEQVWIILSPSEHSPTNQAPSMRKAPALLYAAPCRHYLKAFSQIQQPHNVGKRSVCCATRTQKASCCTTLKRNVLGLCRPLYWHSWWDSAFIFI